MLLAWPVWSAVERTISFLAPLRGPACKNASRTISSLRRRFPPWKKHRVMCSARVKDESRTAQCKSFFGFNPVVLVLLNVNSNEFFKIEFGFLDVNDMATKFMWSQATRLPAWNRWISIVRRHAWGELLHRFRPKCVALATASCPTLVEPLLESQVPCLAICSLASAFQIGP